jgi:putative transposase
MIACNHLPVINGRRAYRDNVFVGRLRRTIKYEEINQHAYNTVPEARSAIGKHLIFYNTKRPHSSLDGQTPDQAYLNEQSRIPGAA